MVLVLNTHPTLGSSMGRYIDALLAALRAHPELQDPDAAVVDGFPDRDLSATHLITVGGQDEPTADGEQEPAQLGAGRREERYTVSIYCSAETGDDQQLARDQAFALLRIVEEVLQRDPGLGVVRFSDVRNSITLQQTGPSLVADRVEAGRQVGRWAQVSAQIEVRNRVQFSE